MALPPGIGLGLRLPARFLGPGSRLARKAIGYSILYHSQLGARAAYQRLTNGGDLQKRLDLVGPRPA